MNNIVQHTLVFTAVAGAVWFLLRKYGVLSKKKKSKSKACGQDDCGCH